MYGMFLKFNNSFNKKIEILERYEITFKIKLINIFLNYQVGFNYIFKIFKTFILTFRGI